MKCARHVGEKELTNCGCPICQGQVEIKLTVYPGFMCQFCGKEADCYSVMADWTYQAFTQKLNLYICKPCLRAKIG